MIRVIPAQNQDYKNLNRRYIRRRFQVGKYSAILGNLRENGFLDDEDVQNLMKEYLTTQKISFNDITDAKKKILSEALIDNYKRLKPNKG